MAAKMTKAQLETELKKAQKRIAALERRAPAMEHPAIDSEKKFRALIENSRDVIALVAGDGTTLYKSPSIEAVMGYKPEELVGKNSFDMFHPEDAEKNSALFDRILSTPGVPISAQARYRHKNGEWKWVDMTANNLLDNPHVGAIVVNYRDMTEQYEMQEQLQKDESRYRSLFEESALSLWEEDFSKVKQRLSELKKSGVTDLREYLYAHPEFVIECASLAQVLDVNKATLELFEADRKEDLLQKLDTIISHENIMAFADELLALDEGRKTYFWEGVNFTTKGKKIQAQIHLSVLPGYEESLSRVIVSMMDVTTSREAEEAQKKVEIYYRSLFEQTHDAVFIMDLQGNHLAANQRAADMLGYKFHEILGLSVADTSAEQEQSKEVVRRLLAGEHIPSYERIFRKKDGSHITVEINVELVRDVEGNPLHIQSVVRDIAERKRIENVLRESEEKYRLVFENASEALYVIQNGQIVFANPMFEKISQIPGAELIGTSILEFLPSQKDRMTAIRGQKLLLRGKIEKTQGEYKIRLRSGLELWVNVSEVRTVWKGEPAVLTFATDITANKLAEEKLRESEKRFTSAFENAAIGMALVSPEGRWLKVNQALCGIIGYTADELTGMTFQDVTHPDDLDADLEYTRQILEGKRRSFQMEKRYLHKDGHTVWALLNASLVRNEHGDALYFISQTQDITERKQAEDALREAETKYRNLVERLPVIVYTSELGAHGAWTYISPQIENLFGFTAEEWMADSELWYRQVHPDDRDRQQNLEEQAWARGESFKGEYRILTRDGRQIWVRDSAQVSPPQNNGLPIVQGVLMDITERKQAEEALRGAEEKYRTIFENSLEGIFQSTPAGRYITVNPALARMWGYDSPEDLLTSVTDIANQVYTSSAVRAEHMRLLQEHGGDLSAFEYQARCKDGSVIWVSESVHSILDTNGALLHYEGTVENISSRKRVEDELRDTKNFVSTLLEVAPISIYVMSLDNTFRLINRQWEEDSKVGREDALGRSMFEIFPAEAAQKFETQNRQVVESGASLAFEEWVEEINGPRCYYTHKFPLRDADGRVGSIGGISLDITERKQADEKLSQSERRYRALFESSPISLWEEDFSEVKKHIDSLKQQGITDFHAYFMEHPQIVGELNKKIRVLNVNQATLNMFRAKDKQALFELLREPSQGERDHNHEDFIAIAEGRSGNSWDGADETLSGEPLEISLSWSVVPGYEDDYSNVIITTSDITERKLANDKIKESEQRYRSLFEDSPISLWEDDYSAVKQKLDELKREGVTDFETYFAKHPETAAECTSLIKILDANKSSVKLFNAKNKEELLAHTRRLLDIEVIGYRGLINLANGMTHFEWEGVNKKLSGELMNIKLTWSVVPGHEEDLSKVVISITDITETKQAHETLKESEKRYRSLFENSPISLWEEDFSAVKEKIDGLKREGVTDFEAYFSEHPRAVFEFASLVNVLDLNEASVKLFKAGGKAELLSNFNELKTILNEQFKYELIEIANGVTRFEREVINQNLKGETIHVYLTWSVAAGYESDLSKVVISIIDITERKLAEAEINRQLSELETLYESGLAISRLLTPKEAAQKVIEVLDRRMNWHHIAIRQYEAETNSVKLLGFQRPKISAEEAEDFIARMNEIIANPGQGLSGWVTLNGEPIRAPNVKADERYVGVFPEIRSGLYVPLKVGERVIGSISVESEVEDAFTEQDQRLLATVAGQAAIAIENANLFLMAQKEIVEREHAESLLQKDNQVMQLIASGALSFHETLEAITRNIESLSHDAFCSILLMTEDGAHLKHGAAPSLPQEYNQAVDGLTIGEGVGSCGTAAYRKEAVVVSDIASDPLWINYRELALKHGLRSCWSTPILDAQNRALGTFAIYHPETFVPTQTDFKLIERATQQAKIVIERKRAETALQKQTEELLLLNDQLEQRVRERTAEIEETRKRLELATDAAGLGIWEWDILTGNLIWDAQMYRIYGVSPESFDGKIDSQLNFIHPQDRDILLGAAQAIVENKETNFKIEHRILHNHGNTRSLFEQGVAVFDERGLLERIIGIVDDITPQKQAEQNLRESEAYARLLFDSAPDPVYVTTADGIMLEVNRLFEQQHHVQRELVRDRHISELNIFPAEQLEKTQEYLTAIAEGKGAPPVELDFYHPDGGLHTLEMRSYPIEVKGRQLILSTSRDITIHKKAEESLRFANTEMERALRMKDEFLANMSHELRTPLNAVLGMSESLEEQIAGPLNEKQLKYIRTIGESGRHLLELINDILDLSKIEAGRMELNVSQISVASLCDASLRMIKEQAQKKGQQVSLTIDPEVKIIMGDERRLKQSLVNLLSNAVKFTPNDQKVGVEVKGNPRSQTVTFTVWDEGIGIAPEELKKIFKPFVQLDSGLTREFSGTGLGLVLVAQMVRLHGGSVSVESKQGQGSRFSITLPWVDVEGGLSAKATSQKTEAGATPEGQRGGKILIVEDTDSIILLISEYLRYKGFHVMTARNGMEGLMLARKEKPDLILMDVMMPVMDGVEATKQIRAQEELRKIPIIALTALAMPGDKERCLQAGMNDYLSKPVVMKELERLIVKHLHK